MYCGTLINCAVGFEDPGKEKRYVDLKPGSAVTFGSEAIHNVCLSRIGM